MEVKTERATSTTVSRHVHAMVFLRLVRAVSIGLVCLVCLFPCKVASFNAPDSILKWSQIEITLTNTAPCNNPVQDIQLTAEFKSPSGETSIVDGFWYGGQVWLVRFSPNEIGDWHYTTRCSDFPDLHNRSGAFQCIPNSITNLNRFAAHGPIKVDNDGRALTHEDGTPFFWMADTTWNGILLSDAKDWEVYLTQRVQQKFTTIEFQSATTLWPRTTRAEHNGLVPFSGGDKISINPEYFKVLDARLDAIKASGLLAAPVLSWAGLSSNTVANSRLDLPEDQAILLTRYMVARWGANPVVWILASSNDIQGTTIDKLKRLGSAIFSDRLHAPVSLQSGANQWIGDVFQHEKWMDIIGYCSQSDTNENSLRWCFSGPQTIAWTNQPSRPFINFGPVFENAPFNAPEEKDPSFAVRRTMYWSLLSVPTAGVSYGNQSVMNWNNRASILTNQIIHEAFFSLKNALTTPEAEQVAQLVQFFTSIQFSRLRPAQDMLVVDPGLVEARRHIAAARTQEGDLAVIYVPEDRSFQIRFKDLPPSVETSWTDPRNGLKRPVIAVLNGENVQFTTPGPGDWLLLLKSEIK